MYLGMNQNFDCMPQNDNYELIQAINSLSENINELDKSVVELLNIIPEENELNKKLDKIIEYLKDIDSRVSHLE